MAKLEAGTRGTAVIAVFAFNEATRLGATLTSLKKCLAPLNNHTIIVVDDGSTDDTVRIANDMNVTVLQHHHNQGVGAAFQTALNYARHQGATYFCHIDGDGQIPPEYIPLLLAPIIKGQADICIGSRFIDAAPQGLSLMHAWGLKLIANMAGFLARGKPFTDMSCGIRCMNRSVMNRLHPTFKYDYIQESLIQAVAPDIRIMELPVTVHYGVEYKGMGHYHLRYISRFSLLLAWSLLQHYTKFFRRLKVF